jgi:predicted PurR-regulated permease PerM
MNNIKTTNALLLLIVIPLIFYFLKILSFIFVPLTFSMFIALMFLPIKRWLNRKGIPHLLSVAIVVLIIVAILKAGGELIQLSTKQILADKTLFKEIELKITELILVIEEFFGIQRLEEGNVILHYLQKSSLLKNFGSTIEFIGDTLSITLMTVFFTILWLSESINFQKLLNQTIVRQKYTSIRVFMRIENDLIKFILVKVFVSLLTGIFFAVSCIIFDVSWPIFWGLFAFVFNFIQMIGSVISVAVLGLFALVEIDPTGTLLLFLLILIGIEILMGGVLEPVLMGKSFSINVITILIMLMFWGYLWGIPGLIMSIPITVFLKIIMEQFPKTRMIAGLISGKDFQIISK